MAVYAIGDVQGCYDPLRRLLDLVHFDPATDKLWFCGDLVNRGPKSLKVLRFVRGLGDSAITVLGNHDLHLLALAENAITYNSVRFGTLSKILKAPDLAELTKFLCSCPLAHYDEALDTVLVHAGLYPSWSVSQLLARAAEVESALASDRRTTFLYKMYGNTPRRWSESLTGYRRLRFIVNTCTRMRMLTKKQALNFAHTGPPWRARGDLRPWYDFENAELGKTRVVFGHWSALGLIVMPKLISLDTGCVWGRQLTAVRLDRNHPRVFQVTG